jgi:nucleoside-diphosphate-sugar epimerase
VKFAGSERVQGRAVFVTGASGFVGRRLVAALLANGARVTALLRSRHGAKALERSGARVVIGALDDSAAMERALRGQDTLFHLAYDMRAPAAASLAAFGGLMAAARAADVGRIVHVSSIVVYDGWPGEDLTEDSPGDRPGGTPYRQAKMAMERALLASDVPAAILQPTLVYGPGSMLWTDRPADWLSGGTVVLPRPEGLCNAVFVDDLVQALLRAAVLDGLGQERFIISGPAPGKWSELLEGYAEAIGTGTVRHVPLDDIEARLPPEAPQDAPDRPPLAARISAAARRILGRERFEALVRGAKRRLAPGGKGGEVWPDRYMLELMSTAGTCRIDRARARLGYAPEYDLAKGLAATAPYLQARHGHGPDKEDAA